jgi:hypothetical protein
MAPGYGEVDSDAENAPGQQPSWTMDNRGIDAPPTDGPVGGASRGAVFEHLSALLQSVDASVRKIVDEAQAKARSDMAEADRRARWVEAESARLAAWSRQAQGQIQALWTGFSEFRREVEALPQKINQVLGPLAAHAPVMARQIEQLAEALAPQAFETASFNPPATGATKATGPAEDMDAVGSGQFDAGWGVESDGAIPALGWDDPGSGTP